MIEHARATFNFDELLTSNADLTKIQLLKVVLEQRLIEGYEAAVGEGLDPAEAIGTIMQWLSDEVLRLGPKSR